MKCINHMDVDAVGICRVCGLGVCSSCADTATRPLICHSCVDNEAQKRYRDETGHKESMRRGRRFIGFVMAMMGAGMMLMVGIYALAPYRHGSHDNGPFVPLGSVLGIAMLGYGLMLALERPSGESAAEKEARRASTTVNARNDLAIDSVQRTQTVPRKGSIITGFGWMVLLQLLLFWFPFFGPLIAGLVGGKKAGSLGNAIMAVLLPAILLGSVVALLTGTLTNLPVVGMVAGAGSTVLVLLQVGPLLVGAIIGGLMAD